MRPYIVPQSLKRRMLLEDLQRNELRDEAFRRIILSIPRGRVSSYGRVAMAAGYPLHHRAVAHLLRKETLTTLPWQRILGSDGEIRLKGEFAEEQRIRLKLEGVNFEGRSLNMSVYEHIFTGWDF
jgi:methylated-DNA-protein-cysteine methyltransferase related protein